jgi:MraZ protein
LAFHGTFEHTLDAKNRLTVPSKFRTALAGRVFLVKAIDRCISVYPEETYSALTRDALSNMNPFAPEARELKRVFFGRAVDVELDGAGRLMLPASYLEHAGITSREVVVTGAGDCLELWDGPRWRAYDADLTERAADLTASLGHPA